MCSFIAILAALTAATLGMAADKYPANGGDIEITPIIHASVQIEYAGKVIQVDPWSVGNLSRAKPADLILITDDVAPQCGRSQSETRTALNSTTFFR